MEPYRPLGRESTAVMAANIGRELTDIRAALAHSRGHLVAEPRITVAALAHLLLCSRELLQNLLIDTACQPAKADRALAGTGRCSSGTSGTGPLPAPDPNAGLIGR